MRMVLVVIVVTLGGLLANPAAAFDWKAGVTHCEATPDRLKSRHLEGKIQRELFALGDVIEAYRVRWGNGTIEDVLLGPTESAQFCVIARRYVGKELAQAE